MGTNLGRDIYLIPGANDKGYKGFTNCTRLICGQKLFRGDNYEH